MFNTNSESIKGVFISGLIIILFQFKCLAQWMPSNSGMGNQAVGALLADGDTLYAGALTNFFKSTDEGDSWFSSNSGLPSVVNFYSIVRSGNYLVAGGDSPGIWQSSNSGANWIRITTGVDSDEYVLSLYADGNNAYAAIGYTSAIGVSSDNGTTWIKYTNGLPSTQFMTGITKLGTNLYATHSALGVYTSTDNGMNWSLSNSGIGAQDKNAIVTSGSNLCVGATNGIWLSTDMGASWSQTLMSGIVAGITTRGNEVYSVGVLPPYKSTDNGISWNAIDDDGLPGSIWNTIQFTTNYALVNYYGVGVYRRLLSEITDIGEDKTNNLPSSFSLEQNYPNPFNPNTKISWQIPVSSHQSLIVYDIMGNEIATLVDEFRLAVKYEVDFDGSNLPSGIYFYQLISTNFNQTKKMILIK